MDKCIDFLGDGQYFTTLDFYSRYWQMNIRKKDQQKTEFVYNDGILQCVRMPVGLSNSPRLFSTRVGHYTYEV